MRELLSIVGPLIAAIGFIPYLKETISGKVKPRIASWATWSLITGIATVAELSHRSYTSAFLTGIATLIEVTILVFALKHGDHTYSWIDAVSQVISVAGLVAWLLSKNANYAIIFNMSADFFGAVPTFYHSWIAPHEEGWQAFIISGVGSGISFLAVKHISFISAGFPIYLSLVGFALGLNIYFRQKVVKQSNG